MPIRAFAASTALTGTAERSTAALIRPNKARRPCLGDTTGSVVSAIEIPPRVAAMRDGTVKPDPHGQDHPQWGLPGRSVCQKSAPAPLFRSFELNWRPPQGHPGSSNPPVRVTRIHKAHAQPHSPCQPATVTRPVLTLDARKHPPRRLCWRCAWRRESGATSTPTVAKSPSNFVEPCPREFRGGRRPSNSTLQRSVSPARSCRDHLGDRQVDIADRGARPTVAPPKGDGSQCIGDPAEVSTVTVNGTL